MCVCNGRLIFFRGNGMEKTRRSDATAMKNCMVHRSGSTGSRSRR